MTRKKKPFFDYFMSVLTLLGLVSFLSLILMQCSFRESRPNILIITVDALRADHLEVYGYGHETAPELAELAARGARFDAATAQAPLTVPSMFIMMTGSLFYHGKIPPAIETLAERLKSRGYTTAAFIRNPLLELDASGIDRGFDTFFAPESLINKDPSEEELHGAAERQLYERDLRAEVLLSKADEWLQQNADKEPFFLWIHLFDPHDPYSPPPPYDTQFDRDYKGTVDGDIRRTQDSDNPIWEKAATNPAPEDRRHIVALYDGEVRYASAQIGAFLKSYEEKGLNERTLIVFSSDHGESLGEHRMWGHGVSLYESELHIPLFMIMPGTIPAGAIIPQPVESIDIVPTILSLVGIKPDNGLSGKDLAPFFKDGSVESGGVFARWDGAYSYRKGRWKLIVGNDRKFELYDLETDPSEKKNLVLENPEMLRKMHGALKHSAYREIAIDEKTDKILKDKLKSLGYL